MQETDANNNGASAAGGQHLSFVLGNEEYGIEILRVSEIKGYSTVTPIPNTPAHIKGVINLRGAVVPVIDLRCKFAMEPVEYTKFTVIVLVVVGGRTVGLVVDAVRDVLSVGEEDVRPAPELGVGVDMRFLKGMATVGDKLVALLDIDRLLGDDFAVAQAALN